jgi:putative ABC transport system permease protein
VRLTALFTIALRSLARNKLRSILTMLGIVIGVAAVIAMLAVGQGARDSVEKSIASLGTNVIIIFPGALTQGGINSGAGSNNLFTEDDVPFMRRESEDVSYISPMVRNTVQIKAGGQNWRTSVYGVYPEYLNIRDMEIQSGISYTASDEKAASKVCLLGKTVSDNLFGVGSDPVGRTIRIKNEPFRVIGYLVPRGQNALGQDQDDVVLAPYSTVLHKVLGGTYAQSFFASAISTDAIPAASKELEDALRQRQRIPDGVPSNFTIRTQTDLAQAATATSQTLTILLASIAAISLLVGGIGIMNIMLVSVTERTREIGIRLAVGALGRDILLQFLVEALVMSIFGGLLGVIFGVGTSAFLAATQGWAVSVSPVSILVAFGFSAATGIFFGWYPARKASQLNPIDALRYE